MNLGISIDFDCLMDTCPEVTSYLPEHLSVDFWCNQPDQTYLPGRFDDICDWIRHVWPSPDRVSVLACQNHVHAYRFFRPCDLVINFDAHRDDTPQHAFGPQWVGYDTWTAHIHEGYGTLVCTIPDPNLFLVDNLRSLTDGSQLTHILLCHSAPWINPQYDEEFLHLLTTFENIQIEEALTHRPDRIPPGITVQEYLSWFAAKRHEPQLIPLSGGDGGLWI